MSKGKTTKRIRWATIHKCTCTQCGATFESIRPHSRHCSARCRMAAHRGAKPLAQPQAEGGEGERGHEGQNGQVLALA